jgi:aspartate racemase
MDHAAMAAAVREGLQKLAASDADFLAIACNTAHVYFDELKAAVDVPLLDMVQLTVERIPPAARRVALVAARPTAESAIYQQRLTQHGFTVVDIDAQDDVDALLLALRTNASAALAAGWSRITGKAEAAGVDAIVVACLDLSATVVHATTAVPMVDASRCLAEALVMEWLRRRDAVDVGPRPACGERVPRSGG